MSEGPAIEMGRRFSADLRRIREARGVTVAHLHDETKIPLNLIEAFEQTGLFDHDMFNRVYLRSFVRTYADVIGIDAEQALQALEKALGRNYSGELAAAYLEEEAPPAHEPTPEADGPSVAEAEVQEEDEAPEEASPAQPAAPERSPAAPAPVVAPPPVKSPPPPLAAETPEPLEETIATPLARRRAVPNRNEGNRQWIYIAAGLAVIALAVFLMVRFVNTPEPDPNTTAEVVAPPEVDDAAEPTPVSAAPPQPAVSIGETMQVTIIAENDKVQNIKVQVDDDLRRPYWIELGETKSFEVSDRIVIEQQLDLIRLQVDGHEYPTDQRDDRGRIVITPERAEEVLNQANRL